MAISKSFHSLHLPPKAFCDPFVFLDGKLTKLQDELDLLFSEIRNAFRANQICEINPSLKSFWRANRLFWDITKSEYFDIFMQERRAETPNLISDLLGDLALAETDIRDLLLCWGLGEYVGDFLEGREISLPSEIFAIEAIH